MLNRNVSGGAGKHGIRKSRDTAQIAPPRGLRLVEPLEERLLFSQSATAQLNLVSTAGTGSSAVYTYDAILTNTGTTPIATFWMSWIPGEDLLPTTPSAETSPAGWGPPAIQGTGDSADGASIQWVAQNAGAVLGAGASLDGFGFTTTDSPAVLAANSVQHPANEALTSFVYSGAPFSDSGFQFNVTPAATGANVSLTSLVGSTSSIDHGQNVGFTAIVGRTSGSTPPPTGTVTFFDGTSVVGNIALGSDGTAAFSTSSLSAGVHSITATYNGDSVYSPSTSSPTTETVINLGISPTIVKSTFPTSAIIGQRAHGVVTVAAANPTIVQVKGLVSVNIYASSDGAIDGSSILLGKVAKKLTIRGSGSTPVQVTIKSLPAGITAGTYTLLARLTDPSSNVTDSTTGPSLSVQAPVISLSEAFSRLTLPATVVAPGKEHALAAIQISNSGNVISSGATTIAIYASTTGVVDGSAVLITSIKRPLHIRPGKFSTVLVPLHQLPAIPAGSYFLVAQVIDPNQQTSSVASATTVAVTN